MTGLAHILRPSEWTLLRIISGAICALCVLIATPPAIAQGNDSSEVRISLVEPLSITKIADMDFGYVIGLSAGTIVMTPSTSPTCTATAGLIQSGVCRPAEFGGAGPTNQRIRIRRPPGNSITLTGPGADMTVTDFTIGAGPDLTFVQNNPIWVRYRINSADGVFFFRVGGTLNVNANQAPGVYSGTFNIQMDYR